MGVYIRLTDYKNSGLKESEFFNDKNRYTSSTKDFSKIPGSPIAYWVSENVFSIYREQSLDKIAFIRQGLATADNNRFLKKWWEVNNLLIGYGYDRDMAKESNKKWFPYNKGGEYKKWYGNQEYLVDWFLDGKNIKEDKLDKLKKGLCLASNSKPKNMDWYFQRSISWSKIASSEISFRIYPKGFIFDVSGCSIFPIDQLNESFIIGLLNSKLKGPLLASINPTMNFEVGGISNFPIINTNKISMNEINELVGNCVFGGKKDWDSRETSWNFKENELLRLKASDGYIKSTLEEYVKHWTTQFFQLHKNEEELNKIFIEIYGLQDELTPDVPLSDITILKDEIAERDEKSKTLKFDELVLIKQFISYAVGCMVGRYSLDVEGLVYAGGEFDPSKYQTFKADKDGIIPILSDDRFDDDITSRFKEYVKVVFGEKNYSSNIEYIATILGRRDDETAIECIRRYFLNEFYKDHVKMYKKRPIYWLYSSGKEKGFNAIVYMHRYKKETISILRMDYLHKLQRSYDTDYETIERQEKTTSDSKQKVQFQKKMISLKAILQELKKYDELLRHYADKQIEIDLDDGVVVNYAKFKDLLVKI